jgi:hypothetical protein
MAMIFATIADPAFAMMVATTKVGFGASFDPLWNKASHRNRNRNASCWSSLLSSLLG